MALVVVVSVLVALVAGVGGALLALQLARRQLRADRAAGLRAAQEALVAERHLAARAAVDTVVAVAGDRFADQAAVAARQLDARNEAVGEQVHDVQAELGRLRHLVVELQRERAEQHGRLEQGLAEALRASSALTSTTDRLREALASTKARGQWGERMAEDVLRAAGFIEGVNYRKQTAVAGGGVPDFTFLLPHQRVLHMDVKFPLDNYLRALDAPAGPERTGYEVAFLRDVRQRVRELADRGYGRADDTVEAVVLFIPNESIYGFIHERDPQLADLALGQQVVLCSPFTLFAVLAVVRQAVDAFLVERTSDEILQCLGGFDQQWRKFTDTLDVLGRRFESTQRAYDDLAGTRRRQLQRSLDRVDELRARRGLAPVELVDEPVDAPAGLVDVPADPADEGSAGAASSRAVHPSGATVRPLRLG
jgi:DNA recombination protein RmuC